MELQQLLKECRQGSLAAQKCLYDELSAGMYLLCRRYMKTNEDAEEMMLNGFLKCFASLSSFEYKNDATAMGWIKKIMINECLMQLRKKNSFLLTIGSDTDEAATGETALEKLSAEEIFRLITRLPVGYRTVFNLYVVEGMNHREIASTLGISEGTSKSQLNKARNLLQQLIIQNDIDYAAKKTK
ncbi:MAG: sigma-70 family RNA polymerase sigma factor [Ferruginibacter sp.]